MRAHLCKAEVLHQRYVVINIYQALAWARCIPDLRGGVIKGSGTDIVATGASTHVEGAGSTVAADPSDRWLWSNSVIKVNVTPSRLNQWRAWQSPAASLEKLAISRQNQQPLILIGISDGQYICNHGGRPAAEVSVL